MATHTTPRHDILVTDLSAYNPSDASVKSEVTVLVPNIAAGLSLLHSQGQVPGLIPEAQGECCQWTNPAYSLVIRHRCNPPTHGMDFELQIHQVKSDRP